MESPEKKWLTEIELARRFGVSRVTWRRWVRDGLAPKPVKISRGATRWALDDIEAMEQRLREAAQ